MERHTTGSETRSVPNIRQVIPGAPVSIMLKADQPTGNEVQGIVAELLTRGDHPRGIKVRLQDGRVGRVQRMVSEETATTASARLRGLGRNGEMGPESNVGVEMTPGHIGGLSGRRYGDFGVDEPEEPQSAGLSLADYVVKREKGKRRQKKQSAFDSDLAEQDLDEESMASDLPNSTTAISKCPVCREFEGDETAVSHHVNGHFE
jgi:uncharacterized repeat protein (TIGR03833 family)